MCVITKKVYVRSGGRREAYEEIHYCGDAGPNRLCSRVRMNDPVEARIEEIRPSSSSANPIRSEEDYFVTEGVNGRKTQYRFLKRTDSKKTKSGPGSPKMDKSPRTSRDLRSSPTFQSFKPEAPTPPPAAPYVPLGASPPYPPTLVEEPQAWKLATDGTAVYSRPPSLDMPRAADNERRQSKPPSLPNPVAENVGRKASAKKRRPSIVVIDTRSAAHESRSANTPSSSSISSPGLSSLPKVRDIRAQQQDLRGENPQSELFDEVSSSRNDLYEQSYSRGAGQGKQRQRHEKEVSARYITTADSPAVITAENVDRERPLPRNVRSSQEMKVVAEDRREIERRRTLDAEARQAKREQTVAEDRRNRIRQAQMAVQQYPEDQLRREADPQARARPQYQIITPTSPISPTSPTSPTYFRPRSLTGEGYPSSPVSARSAVTTTKPSIHYYPSARRSSTLRERGQEVLSQAQAPYGMRVTEQAIDSLAIEDDDFEDQRDAVIEEYVYPSAIGALSRRRSRRDGKGKEREERRKEFFN